MLNSSWQEVAGALVGAIIGTTIPILLHLYAAKFGDAEAMGMPVAFFKFAGPFRRSNHWSIARSKTRLILKVLLRDLTWLKKSE